MGTLGRYWHTVRYLKPVQLYGRLWYRLARPRVDRRPAPALRPGAGPWTQPAARRPSMVGPARFRFLNQLGDAGWDDPGYGHLWRYNLHYFDDLNAVSAHERLEWHRELIRRWIAENSPGLGTGWEAYPTSLRIVNWIKWLLGGQPLGAEMSASLAIQSRWLAGRLERHLLGNHLLVNAKALIYAGLFFDGPEAGGWLETGMAILARELPEQILADGGQFELSPMYHALALEDLLDLWNIGQRYPGAAPARWAELLAGIPEIIARMRRWLAVMSHPDGEIAFFNDSAMQVAPSPGELEAYATRLDLGRPVRDSGLVSLPQSGYLRVEQPAAVALLDVGPVGPDYLPAHAHADTLSFELSLWGARALVNSGTSVYAPGPERSRQRGTGAHNTVVVDGADSSEVWSAFRVARRARPLGLVIDGGANPVVRCAHDGYDRLPGHPRPTRIWTFGPGSLRVEDRIDGRFRHAEARYHLAPGIRVVTLDQVHAVLELPGRQRFELTVESGILRQEASTWHPEFGQSIPSICLAISFQGERASATFSWEIDH